MCIFNKAPRSSALSISPLCSKPMSGSYSQMDEKEQIEVESRWRRRSVCYWNVWNSHFLEGGNFSMTDVTQPHWIKRTIFLDQIHFLKSRLELLSFSISPNTAVLSPLLCDWCVCNLRLHYCNELEEDLGVINEYRTRIHIYSQEFKHSVCLVTNALLEPISGCWSWSAAFMRVSCHAQPSSSWDPDNWSHLGRSDHQWIEAITLQSQIYIYEALLPEIVRKLPSLIGLQQDCKTFIFLSPAPLPLFLMCGLFLPFIDFTSCSYDCYMISGPIQKHTKRRNGT